MCNSTKVKSTYMVQKSLETQENDTFFDEIKG